MPDGSTTTTTDKNKKCLEFIEDITSNPDQVQQPPPVQRPPSPQPDSLRLLYTRVLQQVGVAAMTPRPSNFTGVEIYSVSSSSNQTPRGSNFSIPSGRLLNLGGTELGKLSGRPDHDDDIVASTDQPETKGVGEADEEALHPNEDVDVNTGKQMPPARVMTRLILVMVWRQLIRNLNTYSRLVGLVWSLISFGIFYGTPTKDNSMREFSSRVFDGYEQDQW